MTKACKIQPGVREAVYERDGHCIICGSNEGIPNAHFIPRSHGGLGIEENIVTLCPRCHFEYDNGAYRNEYRTLIRSYLKAKYPEWDEKKLVYGKWVQYEQDNHNRQSDD